MKTIKSIKSMRHFAKKAKLAKKIIGFVPTMGYLHDGHLSLIKSARKRCDILVASIFVNPIQFGPKEDHKKYPRDFNRDAKKLKENNVDVLFFPSAKKMYCNNHLTFVDVGRLGKKLCGASRPGHFKGVATIVAKLLQIVQPDYIYLGLKDFQQQAIIRQMISDLNMDVSIINMPTVRERDGLAISSRNIYLSIPERKAAVIIFKSLKLAGSLWKKNTTSSAKIIFEMENLIKTEPLVKIDYISACNPQNFEEYKHIKPPALIAIAAYVGKTRLIDNILLK